MGLLTAPADGEGIDTVMSEVLDGIRKASPQGLAASKALTTESILAAFTAKAALQCR